MKSVDGGQGCETRGEVERVGGLKVKGSDATLAAEAPVTNTG